MSRKGCGCKTVSSYEHAIRSRFESATGYRWPKISKKDLCELTGAEDAPKEIDLFCRELGISVEVDGGYHRPPKHRTSSSWRATVHERICQADAARDVFVNVHKDKLAKHNGSRPLLRINTDELNSLTQDGLNELVTTLLVEHGVTIAQSLTGFRPPPNPSWQQDGTARNRAAAQAKGCGYPEQTYLGVERQHRFTCPVHGGFTMRAAQMRYSRGGCPRCGQLRRVNASGS